MNGKSFTCATCAGTFDYLEQFPGDLCVTCYANTPAGRYVPTASELVSMWGCLLYTSDAADE